MFVKGIVFGLGFFIGFVLLIILLLIVVGLRFTSMRRKLPKRVFKKHLNKLIEQEDYREAAVFQQLLEKYKRKSKIRLPKGYWQDIKFSLNEKGPKIKIRIKKEDDDEGENPESKSRLESPPPEDPARTTNLTADKAKETDDSATEEAVTKRPAEKKATDSSDETGREDPAEGG